MLFEYPSVLSRFCFARWKQINTGLVRLFVFVMGAVLLKQRIVLYEHSYKVLKLGLYDKNNLQINER